MFAEPDIKFELKWFRLRFGFGSRIRPAPDSVPEAKRETQLARKDQPGETHILNRTNQRRRGAW